MIISLGASSKVEPLFEIKGEKKDNIFYDIYYVLRRGKNIGKDSNYLEVNGIEIITPQMKKKYQSIGSETPLLTELSYNFANKEANETQNDSGFKYLPSDNEHKPPLLLDLKKSGVLGITSNDGKTSLSFIRHIVFELAYYHSPEDLQFVFLFDKEDDIIKQNKITENYRFLPHTNELFDDISQFVFDKNSSGLVFGQLLSIMNERSKSSRKDGE